MNYEKIINDNPIMKRVFMKLTEMGISHEYLRGQEEGQRTATNQWETEYRFRFIITKGHYINIIIHGSRLLEIIDYAHYANVRSPYKMINEKPTSINLSDWIYSEYIQQKKKHGRSERGFTDGYSTYDDSKGKGNKKEWRESFREDFNKRTNDAYEKGFVFTEEQRKEAFAEFIKTQHGDFIDMTELENFMLDYFNRKEYRGRYAKQEDKRKKSPEEETFDEFFKSTYGNYAGFDFNDFFGGGFGNKKQSGSSHANQKPPPPPPPPRSDSLQSILGLPNEKPTEDALKKAYRTKVMEWHPDRNAHRLKEAEEMIKKINNAYSGLKSAYGYK